MSYDVMVIYFCPNFFTFKWHLKTVQLNPRVFILHNGRPLNFFVSLRVLFNMLLFPNPKEVFSSPPRCRSILIRFLWQLLTSKNVWKYANMKTHFMSDISMQSAFEAPLEIALSALLTPDLFTLDSVNFGW